MHDRVEEPVKDSFAELADKELTEDACHLVHLELTLQERLVATVEGNLRLLHHQAVFKSTKKLGLFFRSID